MEVGGEGGLWEYLRHGFLGHGALHLDLDTPRPRHREAQVLQHARRLTGRVVDPNRAVRLVSLAVLHVAFYRLQRTCRSTRHNQMQ